MYVLSLFISVGKSRQWDPWLQRPSCNSKSQSHLWHWAAWSYYLWAPIHHLLGWQRRKTRECGRGKCTDRMHPSACTPNLCMYSCGLSFSSNLTKESKVYFAWFSTDPQCFPQRHSVRRERSPLPDDKVKYCMAPPPTHSSFVISSKVFL